MKKSIWLIAIVLSLCSWSLAYGQTADGVTPAEESICDKAVYTGALWGLCNAYCEAMDCDSKAVNAADVACAKVLDNFISKSGGKEPPCEVFGIPCEKLCEIEAKRDQEICEIQYEKALKACKEDKICLEEAGLIYDNCVDNVDVSAMLCMADCKGLDCATDCYELHLKADDKCYNKHCNSNDCDLKVLEACLENNVRLMDRCLIGCKEIIIIKDLIIE